MFDRYTMRIHVTVMLAFVTLINGQNSTKMSQPTSWTTTSNGKPKTEKRTIKHKPERTVTTTGNDVALEGKVSHILKTPHDGAVSTWRKNNRKFAYDTSRIYKEKDGLRLRINDVRMSDAGSYECQYIYMSTYNDIPTFVIEVWRIQLMVNDDGDLCSDQEVACNGYCIQEDQWCSAENVSLGLIIGGVVGSLIVLMACVLLFLLSRRGRRVCSCVGEPGLTESGMREERALNEYSSSPVTSRRNGAVVSFAAKPTIQIYEREEEYNSDSGLCGSEDKNNQTPNEQNGCISCKTTTV
ncbi:uncharacterized protein LOC144434060 [Glandiceps talaboti]